MSILEDITSREATRIWQACGGIRHLRDRAELSTLVENLDLIRKATRNIKLGGMVRPNSTHLDFAIRKLEFVRDNKGCLCGLYRLDDMFDPNREEASGNVSIENTMHTPEGFVDSYVCKCTVCGEIYRVSEREYHYTWWKWEIGTKL